MLSEINQLEFSTESPTALCLNVKSASAITNNECFTAEPELSNSVVKLNNKNPYSFESIIPVVNNKQARELAGLCNFAILQASPDLNETLTINKKIRIDNTSYSTKRDNSSELYRRSPKKLFILKTI